MQRTKAAGVREGTRLRSTKSQCSSTPHRDAADDHQRRKPSHKQKNAMKKANRGQFWKNRRMWQSVAEKNAAQRYRKNELFPDMLGALARENGFFSARIYLGEGRRRHNTLRQIEGRKGVKTVRSNCRLAAGQLVCQELHRPRLRAKKGGTDRKKRKTFTAIFESKREGGRSRWGAIAKRNALAASGGFNTRAPLRVANRILGSRTEGKRRNQRRKSSMNNWRTETLKKNLI